MSSYEEYHLGSTDMRNYPLSFIRDIIEKEPVEAPFDVTAHQTDNPFLFGILGQSHRIGRWARFVGGRVILDNGKGRKAPPAYGRIIGDAHGRVVLSFEGTYIGWLNPEAYEVITAFDDYSEEAAGLAN